MRTLADIENQIKKELNRIRPYLNAEGGDIEFVSFINGVVHVKMLGACMGCVAIDYTLKDGIEALLVETVPEVIEVVNDTDEMGDEDDVSRR